MMDRYSCMKKINANEGERELLLQYIQDKASNSGKILIIDFLSKN